MDTQFHQTLPISAAIFDKNMVYLACSDQHLNDFGLSEEQVIGKNHYALFPALPQKFHDAHQQALHGSVVKSDNDKYTMPDKSIRYTSWECHPWYDATGDIGGMILYAENTTERTRILQEAKDQAEREQAKWLTILDHVSSGVAVFDASGNQIYANNKHLKIYEFDEGEEKQLSREYIARHFVVQTYPALRVLQYNEWPSPRVLKGEYLDGETYHVKRLDKEYERILMLSGVPIFNAQGAVELAVLVSNDITQQVEHEEQNKLMQLRMEQTQRLESLGVLAGGIAHDFNNLLMAILGHADLALLKLSKPTPATKNLESIKSASLQAADLCTQLLAYSGQGKIEEKEFSMSKLVREMAQILKTSISKNCVLNLNLQENLPMTVGDSSQMRQILMNFAINASDAVGEGSGTINISTDSMFCPLDFFTNDFVIKPTHPGLYITLEVSDNGPGMDKKTLEHIFEPFFTTKFTGRGLGLSAILGIIRSHDGGLRVNSEPGAGATFTVFFPALGNTEGEETDGTNTTEQKSEGFVGKVLLVDDEQIVLDVCTGQLEALGLDVLIARDGMEGITMYQKNRPEIDLVILDLTMPKMGGQETFTILRQLNPNAKIVLASGYAEEDVTTRFSGEKPSGYLRKPYTLEQLSHALSGLLCEQCLSPTRLG